jgi:hypothetical protein
MSSLTFGRLRSYVALAVLQAAILFQGSAGTAAAFDVQQDAFSISNSPGWCFAMTAYSRWYYLMKQGDPPLRQVCDSRGQQRIAKELQEFYSKNLVKIQAEYCNKHYLNQAESFRSMLARLLGGEPQIVLLMNKGSRGTVLHAVLAYEWVPEQKSLKIYDPNYNNQERHINLDVGKYKSLDITYSAICFPEVLQQNEALVRKMENLCAVHTNSKELAAKAPTSRQR